MSNKECVLVTSGRIARVLLKEGFTIVDIRALKENRDKTMFVFKNERNIEQRVYDLKRS